MRRSRPISWLLGLLLCVLLLPRLQADDHRLVVILLGPPGAGKTTQGDYLSKRYKIPSVSSAELAHKAVGKKSKIGKRMKIGLADGALLGDDVLDQLIQERIWEPDMLDGFILDGYPRSTDQAALLERLLKKRGLPEPTVIHLDASEEVVLARMKKRGRADDTPEWMRANLDDYQRRIPPLLEW